MVVMVAVLVMIVVTDGKGDGNDELMVRVAMMMTQVTGDVVVALGCIIL